METSNWSLWLASRFPLNLRKAKLQRACLVYAKLTRLNIQKWKIRTSIFLFFFFWHSIYWNEIQINPHRQLILRFATRQSVSAAPQRKTTNLISFFISLHQQQHSIIVWVACLISENATSGANAVKHLFLAPSTGARGKAISSIAVKDWAMAFRDWEHTTEGIMYSWNFIYRCRCVISAF